MDTVDQFVQAAGNGDAVLVERMLGEGVAAADALDSDRSTALEKAVRGGHAHVVSLLAKAGSDLEQEVGTYQETTPLCLAAALGQTAVVSALLDAGIHPDARNGMGYLALVMAATASRLGHPPTVDLLLDRGANIDAKMKDRTALDWAAAFGQVDMLRHLLERGAEPRPAALAIARSRAARFPDDQRYEGVIGVLTAVGIRDGSASEQEA
ncbi:ankyrin repeat domain-containing protein [Streptomyces sp. NPDC088762]|uniref:ankyrin repeat domain-containing protein n=1 Tax=Streptomyces sp. NPDC088762 TaxID=3365891 RepID=UPI0037F5A5B2